MTLAADDKLRFGVCWYPEQWDEPVRMARDLGLMVELGIDCVRLFEGAWATIEPEQGCFDWSFTDRVLAACAEHGMGVILGTPTYCPPAWLAERYPEAVARRSDGTRWYRHSRRMYDYTDPDYRACCRSVVEHMAVRYAGHPRVWAWQLDNEIWCHMDSLWGRRVRRRFQDWLRQAYGEIGELNVAWGLRFWSNQLSDFDQVDLPGPTPAHHNHHQLADYRNFLSDLAIGFLREQAAIIKRAAPEARVLHNCPFDPVDRAALLAVLDIYGHDHYPAFARDPIRVGCKGLDFGRFRGHAKRLWVIEQQASQVGQTSYRLPAAPPGTLGAAAVQSIGHGADLICWFRWRTFPAAQETNWGGLLPHWGEPGRHYDEALELIAALKPHVGVIARTRALVSVARLLSFGQDQAHRVEPWIAETLGDPEIGREALRSLNLNEDQIRIEDLEPGGPYSVALLPHAVGVDEDQAFALDRWVDAGGELVVGPLAGHRDAALHGPRLQPPPGPLGAVTGTRNPESTTLHEPAVIHGVVCGQRMAAMRYAEVIEPDPESDAEVVATYLTDWLAGKPAVTVRQHGRGRVFHCGVALAPAVLQWLWEEQGLSAPDLAVVTHEPAAEVLTRSCEDYNIHCVINHGSGPAVFHVRRVLADLLTGAAVTNSFTLQPYRWRILREYLGDATGARD
ncbi:MAG: beta-galactosidase [Planctomycetota bacterium]